MAAGTPIVYFEFGFDFLPRLMLRWIQRYDPGFVVDFIPEEQIKTCRLVASIHLLVERPGLVSASLFQRSGIEDLLTNAHSNSLLPITQQLWKPLHHDAENLIAWYYLCLHPFKKLSDAELATFRQVTGWVLDLLNLFPSECLMSPLVKKILSETDGRAIIAPVALTDEELHAFQIRYWVCIDSYLGPRQPKVRDSKAGNCAAWIPPYPTMNNRIEIFFSSRKVPDGMPLVEFRAWRYPEPTWLACSDRFLNLQQPSDEARNWFLTCDKTRFKHAEQIIIDQFCQNRNEKLIQPTTVYSRLITCDNCIRALSIMQHNLKSPLYIFCWVPPPAAPTNYFRSLSQTNILYPHDQIILPDMTTIKQKYFFDTFMGRDCLFMK